MSQWILRGTRRKRLDELRTHGLTHPSNAWFRYPPSAPNDALHAALTLCFYFGISLEGMALYSNFSGSLTEFYRKKPDLTPVVVIARLLLEDIPKECAYDVVLPHLVARSLPYTKVSVAGKLSPFPEVQVLDPSLDDIAAIEHELMGLIAPEAAARFYTRVNDWPVSAVTCPIAHSVAASETKAFEVAVFCERLARRLLPDLCARLGHSEGNS